MLIINISLKITQTGLPFPSLVYAVNIQQFTKISFIKNWASKIFFFYIYNEAASSKTNHFCTGQIYEGDKVIKYDVT